MTEMADRAEIEAHVRAYSDAWRHYGDIEDGREFAYASDFTRNRELNRANQRMKIALRWLNEHDVTEDMLVYCRDTRIYSLPPDLKESAL